MITSSYWQAYTAYQVHLTGLCIDACEQEEKVYVVYDENEIKESHEKYPF